MASATKPGARDDETIAVAGAGPAGLAAAITLARAGRRVIVHERAATVGHRFRRDLQGLDNWSTEVDALEELRRLGLTTDFDFLPCRRGTAFDAWHQPHYIESREPLFYMVERGGSMGSLDRALLAQAQSLGVEVRFNSTYQPGADAAILATGPRGADALAAGYHFDTAMADGYWSICDDRLAPRGYAYLLVMRGRATMKACLFSDFRRHRLYAERTAAAFERLLGVTMRDPAYHAGVGKLHVPIPTSAYDGAHPLAGERAGFQDTLWGFGMRHAVLSGVLAARSLLEDQDYDALWKRELASRLKASVVNRACYSLLGSRGYRWSLRRQAAGDARLFLQRLYQPSLLRRLLLPWAQRHCAALGSRPH